MQQIGRQMNKIQIGWKPKKLGEVVDIRNGRNQQQVLSENGQYPILGSAGNLMGYATDYICESGTTIIGRKGNISKPLFINERFWNVDTAFGFYPKRLDELDNRFLYYLCLNIDFEGLNRGTTIPSLVKSELQQIPLNVPCFSEQQRIVAILDEAFAAINKAKANAERNLNNARELFESYLELAFENKVRGSRSESLESLCELIVDCEHKTAPTQMNGYPSIRTPNIGKGNLILENVNRVSEKTYQEWTRRAIPQANDLILAREAPAGNVAVIPENLKVCLGQRTVLIRPKKDKIDSKYLASLILSKKVQENLLAHSRGATVAHINMKDIRAFKIYNLEPIDNQRSLVSKLSLLSAETKKLEAVYVKKIADLDELKKSLLQTAFSGELTAFEPISKVVELPVKYTTITAIDLQAGIVAFALQRHLEANKANTFKHVKAEKIIHLAEQILNIDLERNPVKDAAGPNDFPHAKKVEFRAEKVGYFNVRKTEIGYEYTPGSQMQSIISKTQMVLDAKVDKLKWLVDLLVPMTTQQAEIIATVYAAWNNLLLSGRNITDEAIVAEAREDWHPDKLKIEREKFFNAIGWMNKVGLVPTGNGKPVLVKAVK